MKLTHGEAPDHGVLVAGGGINHLCLKNSQGCGLMQDVKSKLISYLLKHSASESVAVSWGYLLLGGVAHLSESAGQRVLVQAPGWDSVLGIIGTLLQRLLGKLSTVTGANTRQTSNYSYYFLCVKMSVYWFENVIYI